MGYIDIIIVAILAVGLIRGWRSGFIKQATNLAGIVLAFVLAVIFMDSLGLVIESKLMDYPGLGTILAFLGIFIVVKVAFRFLSESAKTFIDSLHLGGVDNLAGGVIGTLKAGVILSLLLVSASYFRLPPVEAVETSNLYGSVYGIVPQAWSFFVDQSSTLEDIKSRVDRRSEKRAASSETPQ